MATPHDRAHGYIGSTFVGIPQATGQAAAPTVNTSQSGDWFAQNGISGAQPTASVGQPAPAIEGYNAAKLADQSQGTTAKYIIGRYLQAHPGDYQGAVQQPGLQPGWTVSGGDQITSPEGSRYDLARDATGANGQPGANVQQFTYVGGGPAGTRNNGIRGDDPNSANYTQPGGLGYRGTAPAPPGTAAYVAQQGGTSSATGGGNPSGMAMPTAPAVTNLAAPSPFTYQANQQGDFVAPSQTPEMAQQSYNPLAAPTPLSYENLATPEGYKAQEYTGMTAEQLQSDPSYQFRLKAGQDALENTLARTGSLRGGNAANALMAQGQGMASQEYAAADARARATNQMNNATSLGAYQTNAQTGLAYNQNANQNALNFGQANYNQGFQTNQANNQGQNAAIAANNATALAQQGQQYGQAANTYGMNQSAQQQAYQQALGAYGQNAQTGLAYGAQNQQNALANYQAQTNAALGVGNLNLGYTQAANQYSLGQGNLALGQGQLAQQGQNQAFNQANQTYQNNYQANVTDPWNQQYQLANLGRPVVPD